MKHFGGPVAALVAAVFLIAAGEAYTYTATLKAPSRIQGAVTASGIRWACQGTSCVTSGPWPVPGIGACAALAQQVGEIIAYGYTDHLLSAKDLGACNAKVVASGATPNQQILKGLPPILRPQQGKPQQPSNSQPPSGQGQPPSPPPATDTAFVPKNIRTPQLTITGTGTLEAAPRGAFEPKNIRTPALTITGTGALPGPRVIAPFTPLNIRTPTLTITGTGHL